MWLWLVSTVVLILTWLGGYISTSLGFRVPLYIQLAITLLVVLTVCLVLLYRRYRAVSAAKGLREELLRQSEKANVLPAERANVDALRQRFEQGVEALKASRHGKGSGAQALYTLPWYVIIGPPGAGKTTALRHSGLEFPSMGSGLRGAGGTRNCDWWFSTEAILLDTAGRWSVQSDDHEEWISFLGLLRRFRSKKPLNGLIVAVAVDQLMQSSEEQIQDLAKKLRSRVDEVITELRMVLPVYLMLTKADLVGGFVEYFSEMRLSERQQIVGATLTSPPTHSPSDRVLAEFDLLMRSLERRTVQRLGEERHPLSKQKIYQFPLELIGLREPLAQLAATLFQKNPFQENPTFRGFYLTSGTQEGRPIDRVISGMANAFGLRGSVLAAPVPEPKSYFVSDMFRRVIFPDRNIASRTDRELRRQQLLRLGVAAASLLIALLILMPGALSFAANRKLIKSVATNAQSANSLRWRDNEALNAKLMRLEGVKADILQLQKWRDDGPPAHMGWGMYAGDTLEPALVESYAAAMNAGFAGPTQEHLEQQLARLVDGKSVALARYSEAYDLLKLYLMTSMPDKLDLEWALPRLENAWRQAYEGRAEGSIGLLTNHLALYWDLVKAGRIKRWEPDAELVARSRRVLLNVPVLDRVFELLIKSANDQYQPLAHREIFYGAVAPFVRSKEGVKVPGAYSRRGWALVQVQLEELEKTLDAESWVLGTQASHEREDIEARIKALRAKYFTAYLAAWRAFLMDLKVEKPKTARRALREVEALTEPRYPYERLLATIRERAVIDEIKVKTPNKLQEKLEQEARRKVKGKAKLAAGAAEQAAGDRAKEAKELTRLRSFFTPLVDFLGPEDIGDRAASSGLERYQAVLRRLSNSLKNAVTGKRPQTQKELRSEIEQARREAQALLEPLDAPTEQLLKPFLLNPVSYSGIDPSGEDEDEEPQIIGLFPDDPGNDTPVIQRLYFSGLPVGFIGLAFAPLLLLLLRAKSRQSGFQDGSAPWCATAQGA